MKNFIVVLIITLGMFLGIATPAMAEWYVGGQAGFVKPHDLKDVEGVGNSNGISFSDQDLENAFGYGVKAGYFFPDSLDWLGLEFEVFTANPHVKQQNVTATVGNSSTSLDLSGNNLRVITPAINVIFRFPGYYVEPYIGGGIGAFWGRLSDSSGSDNDIAPGVNSLIGVRFYFNEHVALFTEYKYNYTKFKFGDTYKATYISHNYFGGLSYHF